MLIDVTKDHISRGFKYSPKQCPIALAVREAMKIPREWVVYVSPQSCWVRGFDFYLPEHGIQFMKGNG
jgi:hypothetical protein